MACGCTKFYQVAEGNNCWEIANSNGISLADFYAWNPATANDCKNLFPKDYVCVARGPLVTPKPTPTKFVPVPCSFNLQKGQYVCPTGSPSTQRPTTTAIRIPAPGPTQTGIPANCNKWVLQKDGVYCYDMAKAAGIPLEKLYSLNPALNGDCSGLWLGYAYCLGTS